MVACFFLSGFAALLYETVWLRQFSLVFGTSELAVAAVLAAYMGGLAAGAAVAARLVSRVRRPVLVYGLLEAGVALTALAVPWLLEGAGWLYGWALGERPAPPDAVTLGQPIFYLVVAFAVLALPTGFMGATLPLLVRDSVRSDRDVGGKVGLLYAVNTAGAVLGTLVAGFLLLPALGLLRTTWIGVIVNALVFVVAARLARAPGEALDADGATTVSARAADPARRAILPIVLVSGAVAFLYEVLWTRLLAHVLGGSIEAFATMLAAFLAGIAVGSAAARRLAESRRRAAASFAGAQVGIALLSMAIYAAIGPLTPEGSTPAALAGYAIAVLFPATVFIGATFPLAVRVLARDGTEAPARSAQTYAWNTVGSILGSVAAAFLVIPALGFEGTVRLAVLANLGLAAATLAGVAGRRPRPLPLAAVLLALAAAALLYRPSRPEAVISRAAFAGAEIEDPIETFYAVGRSATVRMVEQGGSHYLSTNGLPEAEVRGRGSPPTHDAEVWLTALPTAARPRTGNMLVIGLGGGVALRGVPPSVAQVDVIELEPEVVRANRRLAGRRRYDPLEDDRFRIVVNDARNALRLTRKRYDAIVSQPSHPWTAGASHLYTREFLGLAKEHLEEGGVFVQWMNAGFLTEPLLRSLAATLRSEFREVLLYHPFPRVLIFLGSDAPLRVTQPSEPAAADHYREAGILGNEDWLAALALDGPGVEALAAGAALSTDDDNRMATRSRTRADGLGVEELFELFARHDPLLDPDGWIHRAPFDLELAFVARRLLRREQPQRAAALARRLPAGAARDAVLAELHRHAGGESRAIDSWRAALEKAPEDSWIRYELGLDPPPGAEVATAVVAGRRLERVGDWKALAALEPALARSRGIEPWFVESARLRAQWRVRAATEGRARAAEALELVDKALPLARGEDLFTLYLLRAQAAIALGDRDSLVESARDIAASVEASLPDLRRAGDAGQRERAILKGNLRSLAAQLEGEMPAGVARRAARVRAQLELALERLTAT